MMKVEQMWTACCRELNADMNFTSCKWRGRSGVLRRWSHILLKTMKILAFRYQKQLECICTFGSLSRWRLLEGMHAFIKKFSCVDWHWWNNEIYTQFPNLIDYFFYSVICIKKFPISQTTVKMLVTSWRIDERAFRNSNEMSYKSYLTYFSNVLALKKERFSFYLKWSVSKE